ncbi:hypothetical protein BH18ACI1_BH18ACI1_15840 [soil metagenome]
MEANQIQLESYYCRKCHSEIETNNPICPQCGRKMQIQSQIKGLGKVLVILGIVISLGSGLFVLGALAILLFAKNSDKDIAMAFTALSLFGAALAAGITAIIGGAWQAKHGRTSKKLVWIFFGLVFLIFILGRVFSFLKN